MCVYYAILRYFFKKILKNSTFISFQLNLQDMLTIPYRTCTLNFIFLSASLLLLDCFQVEIMEIIYANLFDFYTFLKEKIVLWR